MIERRFYMTAFLNEKVAQSEAMAQAVTEAVERFNRKDWGKVCQEDKELNNEDLRTRCGHVLARYDSPEGDIYINMDFYKDIDSAVVMFVHEY